MPKYKQEPPPVRRAALYIRVSTEEQAQKGYSLEAQREDLAEYAQRNGYYIVDYYVDQGKSARKKFTRRGEFMRMMEDVQEGKIDVILFIKLDRWFRNVADYYKIQEILDQHGVAWKTTQEHYDTETTNGRLYINIRLSVAQDESDRDSDRIKFVFDSKVARGEVITGSLPLGLKIQDKHIVPDPDTAPAARAVFDHFKTHHSIYGAVRMLERRYGLVVCDHTVRHMLRNPLYAGRYRDNERYCIPLISPEEFDAIQGELEERSVRANQSGRVYLFAGLVTCALCGQAMTGNHNKSGGRDYSRYRCRNAVLYRRCDHRRSINEGELEDFLLAHLSAQLSHHRAAWAVQPVKLPKVGVDRGAVRRKLEKLKDLYLNDLITLDQYKADHSKYSAMLEVSPGEPPQGPDLRRLDRLLEGDLVGIYRALEPVNRRAFWRGIVNRITLDRENRPRVTFR